MRTIRVISTQSDRAQSVESAASTWGELQSALSGIISNVNDMKAIVRETRVSLESPEAQLPEGNFTVILSMKKIASGNETRYTDSQLKELRTKLNNLFNDLLEEDEDETPANGISAEEDRDIARLREQGLIS
jgi:hypothetical protein